MEHVPTLCALSTVGIAPIGLALGCPEQDTVPRPASNKRKAPGSSDGFRSFSSPLPRSIATPVSREPSSGFRPPSAVLSRKEQADFVHSQSSVVPRATIPSWTPLQSEGHIQSSSPLTEATYPRLSRVPEVGTTRRTSASWLRRISTSSSIRDHSSRPTTPSISFSNRSSQPIFPSDISSPASNEPNKLVKRTTSYSALRQTPTYTPTFKRPATSHQRSAEFRYQMALQEESEIPDNGSEPNSEIKEHHTPRATYRPYFATEKMSGPGSQPRKRHTSGSTKTTPLKTIKDEADKLPTLVMATSIAPRTSEDDLDDTEDRPATRMGDIQKNRTSAKISSDLDNEARARPSSTFGDMFSSGTSGWRLSRGGSLRKKHPGPVESDTVRHVSSPIMPPPSRGSKRVQSGSRLQRRRNITDPSVFKATKVPPRLDIGVATAGGSAALISSPLPPVSSVSAFEVDLPGGTPTFPKTPMMGMGPLSSHPTQGPEPSSTPAAPTNAASRSQQHKRTSQAGSDPASTLVSDGDTRVFTSGDEESMDFQSDTAYDSLATRATASSHSGLRGPRIETIFDESPPHGPTKAKLVPLEDLIQGGSFSERFSSKSSKPSMFEDSDGDVQFSTPVKETVSHDDQQVSEHVHSVDESGMQLDFPSSPPALARRISADQMEDDQMALDEDEDWDADEGESNNGVDDLNPPLPTHSARRFSPLAFVPSPTATTEACDDTKASKRSSIFEWSEQQKPEKDTLNGSSPRPKTVHGKQAIDSRGSRTAGRRGPSALHLRSQSVPVTRDSNAENIPPGGNKFGTWGLGNKGVSEEWTDDFEFDEAEGPIFDVDQSVNTDSISSGKVGMKVPQSIIDCQEKVHIQFGQVQELTLLVGELKRLRAQAGVLNLIEGQSASLWDEAEAIINLATVDEEEEGLQLPRSPGSPTFGFDEFDDEYSTTPRNQNVSAVVGEGITRRNSVLRRSVSGPATPPATRPRGESTAQAKTLVQHMYQTRSPLEKNFEEMKQKGHDKVPFDTTDLRNLVGRAGAITRALKEIVRKAEGVTHSPDNTPIPPRDPPFSQIFNPTVEDSPTKKHHLPKSPSAHSYFRGSVSPNSETELSGHMKLMTVV